MVAKREHNCFLTADAALICRDEVLLVRRKNEPFRGKWCLPGGFVDPDELVQAGALRELQEETGVAGVELHPFGVYSDPGRDPRGRTVTFVFWAALAEKPKTVASDDAAECGWFRLDNPPEMAFDHGKILADIRSRLNEVKRSTN
jgi:8-oxo-dGTP diphosphatase